MDVLEEGSDVIGSSQTVIDHECVFEDIEDQVHLSPNGGEPGQTRLSRRQA